jgi:hypothetical protein
MQINIIDIRTGINDIIAPDEYQALLCGPQWVYLGFLLKLTPSALKNFMHAQCQL